MNLTWTNPTNSVLTSVLGGENSRDGKIVLLNSEDHSVNFFFLVLDIFVLTGVYSTSFLSICVSVLLFFYIFVPDRL